MIKFPKVTPEYFPLAGGLDLLTPAISMKPGRAIDAQNYEPEISGGYRRIDGYERYDGHSSPTDASYWIFTINQTGSISVGDTLTGATSAATCKVLYLSGSTVVAGRMSGTLTSSENLTISTVDVGNMTSVAQENGASDPSDDADYALLAANDKRTDILAVPGSGRIRGVHVFNDVRYAFRDNAGGTACEMYKATASGWSLVNLGRELSFTSGGTYEIALGNTITGATSGATAVITRVILSSGSWAGGDAAGRLYFTSQTGTFESENLNVGSDLNVATIAGDSSEITLLPGGRFEIVNANFTGSTDTERMYGCDGVNKAFEFDGTAFVPIRTGMTNDSPSHIIEHRNYLFLSFLGSVQLSAIGNPHSWSVVLGAGELGTGAQVSGFVPQSGSDGSSALAIFTAKKTFILYGASTGTFNLVPSKWEAGYAPFTMQSVGNDTYGLTAGGIQALQVTQEYGNFKYASVSHLIQSLINAKPGMATASTVLKDKNQYRLFFSDNTAIAVGLTGSKVSGLMPLNYGLPVRCICTAKLSTGEEVTYFGSDDGYIYQDNVGTSFDGNEIEAWLRLAFNHQGSPQVRKRLRRAVLECYVKSYCQVNITYDLGYGNPDVQPSAVYPDQELIGGGGYWDQFTWDQFTWDTQSISNPSISLDGTEKNISLIFYSNRAQDASHTLQGVTLMTSPRRLER